MHGLMCQELGADGWASLTCSRDAQAGVATSGGRGEGVDVEQLIGSGTELTSPQHIRPHGAKSLRLHARRPGHAKTTFVRMNEATSSQIASQRWGLLEPCEPRSPRVASLKAVFRPPAALAADAGGVSAFPPPSDLGGLAECSPHRIELDRSTVHVFNDAGVDACAQRYASAGFEEDD